MITALSIRHKNNVMKSKTPSMAFTKKHCICNITCYDEMINIVWLNQNYRPEMFVFHSQYIRTVQIALARTIDLPSGISAKY